MDQGKDGRTRSRATDALAHLAQIARPTLEAVDAGSASGDLPGKQCGPPRNMSGQVCTPLALTRRPPR